MVLQLNCAVKPRNLDANTVTLYVFHFIRAVVQYVPLTNGEVGTKYWHFYVETMTLDVNCCLRSRKFSSVQQILVRGGNKCTQER